jgi:hypothetical protein
MTSRARYLGRRSRVRQGIPDFVQIPKFVDPSELSEVRRRKQENPSLTWRNILRDVLLESRDSVSGKK